VLLAIAVSLALLVQVYEVAAVLAVDAPLPEREDLLDQRSPEVHWPEGHRVHLLQVMRLIP
jgi:hypothetical protein